MKLTATIALFTLTASLSAMEMRDTDEDVSSLVNAYDKATLTDISNELIKMASHEETIGEFDLATIHYKRALKIRESIGLKGHKSYASILYLSSNAQFQAGYSCEASAAAKDASVEFAKHGLVKYQVKAMADHETYGKVCALVAMK
jgi:hypothetical protein